MGNRKNRRKRRSEASKWVMTCQQQGYLRYTEQVLQSEEQKQKQSEYMQYMKDRLQDLTSRTVWVDYVQDLKNHPENLHALKSFLTCEFGPVQECSAITRHKPQGKPLRFPPAKVVFARKEDAEKIFNGKGLSETGACRGIKLLPCRLGCYQRQKTIRIKPYDVTPDVMEVELQEKVISIDCISLALGTWFPSEDEIFDFHRSTKDVFLEESSTASDSSYQSAISLKIDPTWRKVEVVALGRPSTSTPQSLNDFFSGSVLGKEVTSETISFKFKHLEGKMILYKKAIRYYVIWALKNAPKIERESVALVIQETERCCTWRNMRAETLGRCNAFKLEISAVNVQTLLYHNEWRKLCQFGVFGQESDTIHSLPQIEMLQVGDKDYVSFEKALSKRSNLKVVPSTIFGLQRFESHTLYVRALVDQRTVSWYDIMQDRFFEALDSYVETKVVRALESMLTFSRQRTRHPTELFKRCLGNDLTIGLPPDHCQIPRLHITPLRDLFEGFEIEMSNRVIRQLSGEHGLPIELFLRVWISDEDGQNLFDQDISREIESRIKESMKMGIELCGRRYRFLGYSSSQLTEASFWMFCESGGTWRVDLLWSHLGDFSNCLTPSKYAARMGQCFSTTVDGLETQHGNDSSPGGPSSNAISYLKIDDIASSIESKPHSDGNGLIRGETMLWLLRNINFEPSRVDHASIVQIRYGGAKGTLTAWAPSHDSRLASHNVFLRSSMIKFKAPYKKLEVCKVGTCVPYHLNRNVIFLLRDLGVPEEVFTSMQRELIQNLNGMMIEREQASKLLPSLSGPDSKQRMQILHMLGIGSHPSKDPFLLDALACIRNHHLFYLRKKARIFVDKGAVLMGGIDVTGKLPEGCVYVELQTTVHSPSGMDSGEQESFKPLLGPILVTKHPVMHPGDVRMMLAVDIPALRGIRNSILFSQKGERPAADMMSGSDLDGDEFAIAWDNRLFIGEWNGCTMDDSAFVSSLGTRVAMKDLESDSKTLQQVNRTPMEFDKDTIPGRGLPNDFDGKKDAIVDHFVNHMKLASVGRICMLWLDYASVSSERSECTECLKLAELHSVAVDFPKSGAPAVIPRELLWGQRARAHWREHGEPAFHCTSTVGKLYDELVQHEDSSKNIFKGFVGCAGRDINKYGQLVFSANIKKLRKNLLDIYQPDLPLALGFLSLDDALQQRMLQFSLEQSREYVTEVVALMRRYFIHSEGEVMTGCIRKFHKLHKKRSHQFAEDVRRHSRELRLHYRKSFFRYVLYMTGEGYPLNSTEDGITIENPDILTEPHADESKVLDINDAASDVDGDDVSEEIEIEAELTWVEKITTAPTGSAREEPVRSIAQQLAAAYYMVTYSPDFFKVPESGGDKCTALFSFPWVVSDVISAGVLEGNARSRIPTIPVFSNSVGA